MAKSYIDTLSRYADVINKKAERGEMSAEKHARLSSKILEWANRHIEMGGGSK